MQIGGRQTRDQANGYYDFSGLNPFFFLIGRNETRMRFVDFL